MLSVLDLFSGIGGISLGLESTGGFRTVAFCEVDAFCREVLRKHWPEVPCFDDVRRLCAAQLVGQRIDAIVGGFPCQPHSVAGKRKGKEDERHLWPEFARLVRELRPRWVLAENVPGIRSTAADDVLSDLEAAGYSCWPLVVGADDVGAPHRRKRVWFVAHRVDDARRERLEAGRPRSIAAASRTVFDVFSQRAGAAVADGDPSGRSAGLRCVLHDGVGAAQRDDADGRGERPVGSPTGQGLEGLRADAGEPEEPEPRNAGALGHAEDIRCGIGPDAGRDGETSLPIGIVRSELARSGEGPRWPARPGEPQHEWEEPRLAHAQPVRRDGGSPDGRGDEPHGPAARRDKGECHAAGRDGEDTGPRRAEQPLGTPAHGLPLDLVRLARRHNREALKAAGNSVVPQVVAAIGLAILAAEAELS